jgi:hypothetical protein
MAFHSTVEEEHPGIDLAVPAVEGNKEVHDDVEGHSAHYHVDLPGARELGEDTPVQVRLSADDEVYS